MKEKFQWKKINLNKWLENKTFLWVMSLIIAVGVWGTIVYNLYPDTTKVIQGVPSPSIRRIPESASWGSM